MTKEQFEAKIDHISRIYEKGKEDIYRNMDMSKDRPSIQALHELRNLACEYLQLLNASGNAPEQP